MRMEQTRYGGENINTIIIKNHFYNFRQHIFKSTKGYSGPPKLPKMTCYQLNCLVKNSTSKISPQEIPRDTQDNLIMGIIWMNVHRGLPVTD